MLAWPSDHTLGPLLKKTCVDLARARVHHSLTSLSSRSPMISSWSMLLRSCTRCRNSSRWQPLTASLNWWGWQSIRIWVEPPGAIGREGGVTRRKDKSNTKWLAEMRWLWRGVTADESNWRPVSLYVCGGGAYHCVASCCIQGTG